VLGRVEIEVARHVTVQQRAARMGVNPRTGERITIAGGRVPRFSAGSALKKQVKG
jgi:DNA-binding protein HU-beta